jgi:hypothetical protein
VEWAAIDSTEADEVSTSPNSEELYPGFRLGCILLMESGYPFTGSMLDDLRTMNRTGVTVCSWGDLQYPRKIGVVPSPRTCRIYILVLAYILFFEPKQNILIHIRSLPGIYIGHQHNTSAFACYHFISCFVHFHRLESYLLTPAHIHI